MHFCQADKAQCGLFICACGCSFPLNLIHDVTKKMASVKEIVLSPSHASTGDAITSTHIFITGNVHGFIDLLVENNLFTPNFGAKKAVCALRDEFHHYTCPIKE
jgi:hypothetical protein